MQHQFLRALAFRAQESLQPHHAARLHACDQPGLRLESHRGDFRFHFSPGSGLALLRLVVHLEIDDGDPGGGVAQRAQLEDFSLDDYFIQAAGAAAGGVSGRASAGAPLPSPLLPSIIDLDFSSRIIGEGAVWAFGICTMR